mgnify:CR=1 FL=1
MKQILSSRLQRHEKKHAANGKQENKQGSVAANAQYRSERILFRSSEQLKPHPPSEPRLAVSPQTAAAIKAHQERLEEFRRKRCAILARISGLR